MSGFCLVKESSVGWSLKGLPCDEYEEQKSQDIRDSNEHGWAGGELITWHHQDRNRQFKNGKAQEAREMRLKLLKNGSCKLRI